MSYDTQCYALAEAFLADTPDLVAADHAPVLAQEIQNAIEDYLAEALRCAKADVSERENAK